MRLPNIRYPSKTPKLTQERFSGIERDSYSSDGSVWDMMNISTSEFPLLSTISNRKRIPAKSDYKNLWYLGTAVDVEFVIAGNAEYGHCVEWEQGISYSYDDIVIYEDGIYRKIVEANNDDSRETPPLLNTAHWERLPYGINGKWTSSTNVEKNSIYYYDNNLYVNLTGINSDIAPDEDSNNWAPYRYADFYYNNSKIEGIQLIAGEKECSYLNGYIIILPDKVYYNTDSGKFGYMEGSKSGTVNTGYYTGYYKNGYGRVDKVLQPWLTDGKSFGTTGTDNVIEFFWAASGLESPSDHADGGVFDLRKFFRVGDAIKITQKGRDAVVIVDGTYAITGVKLNALIFSPSSFAGASRDIQSGDDTHIGSNKYFRIGGDLILEKIVPDMDHVCVAGNRMWGCYDDTVYASALGDPLQWNRYSGRENDPVYLESGEEGNFTGCCEYSGYPMFFKQSEMYRVYGSGYSSYALSKVASYGLREDSPHSVCVVNSMLFFLSESGVCVYNGGVPAVISGSLKRKFTDAIAGTDGVRYYISVDDGRGRKIYVYDTDSRIWSSEYFDDKPLNMIKKSIVLMCVTADGSRIVISHSEESDGEILEPGEKAYIEFNDFYNNNIDKKTIGKVVIRASVNPMYNPLEVYIQYDSDGMWRKIGEIYNKNEMKKVSEFSFYPMRCDHYRLRLECKGKFTLYALARQTE